MKIVQLVPHPLDWVSGISDYSLKVADRLSNDCDLFTHFLVYEKQFRTVSSQRMVRNYPVEKLTDSNPETFLALLPEDLQGLIFHYNFGVQDRRSKTAFGLWRALRFAQRKRNFKLIVMFHELTLTFKLKGIPFFHPLHFVAVRGLARMADAVLTNSTRFKEILSPLTRSPVACLPNFSNFGEPKQVPPLAERARRMLVLGTIYSRPRVYRTRLKELLTACQTLGIQEIYDIGPPFNIEVDKTEWGEVKFVQMGIQSPDAIAQLMLNSQAGFLDYSGLPGDLGKSGVFAAYCAHGLLPVNSRYNPSEADGLEMNKHYVVPNESLKKMSLNHLQAIAENARQWYETHSLTEHAKFFASALVS